MTIRPAPGVASTAPAPATTVDVAAIFRADCATCHGDRGQGSEIAPAIATTGAAHVDFELSTGRMPLPQGAQIEERGTPRYDDETRAALVAYVVGLAPHGAPAGPPIPEIGQGDVARGGEIFRLQCAACHSAAGRGGALIDQRAPALDQSTALQTAEAVRVGPGTMPVFGPAAISDQDLADVTAYVQQLQEPDDRGGAALGHFGPLPEGAVAVLVALPVIALCCLLIERRGRPA
jgi:ubiquinol-cytochrome c reductase cytochrome c subunit